MAFLGGIYLVLGISSWRPLRNLCIILILPEDMHYVIFTITVFNFSLDLLALPSSEWSPPGEPAVLGDQVSSSAKVANTSSHLHDHEIIPFAQWIILVHFKNESIDVHIMD